MKNAVFIDKVDYPKLNIQDKEIYDKLPTIVKC